MLVRNRNVDFAVQSPPPTRVRAVDSNVSMLSLYFFLLIALSVAFARRPLIATLTLAWRDDQYTHILLILPIVASLIYQDWRDLRTRARQDLRLGLTLLASSAFIASFLWSRPASFTTDLRLSISMFALVTWWVGAFLLCFGTLVARAYLFPLCFLFGLVPLPQAVLDVIIRMLQQGSSLAAYSLFTVAGVPAVRNGVMLSVPSLTIEVAKECSSIRSSLMLVMTTLVLAHLLLKSPWRRALAVAVAIPVSVAKNGLRIFTIVMLGTRVDPGYLNGRLHRQGGVIFFAISLIVVGVLLLIMRRREHRALYSKRTSPQLQRPQLLEN